MGVHLQVLVKPHHVSVDVDPALAPQDLETEDVGLALVHPLLVVKVLFHGCTVRVNS